MIFVNLKNLISLEMFENYVITDVASAHKFIQGYKDKCSIDPNFDLDNIEYINILKSIIRFSKHNEISNVFTILMNIQSNEMNCIPFYGFNIIYSIAYGSLDMIKKCIEFWVTNGDEDIDPDFPIDELIDFANHYNRSDDITDFLKFLKMFPSLGHMKHGSDYEISNDKFIQEWTTHKLWVDDWTQGEIFEPIKKHKKGIIQTLDNIMKTTGYENFPIDKILSLTKNEKQIRIMQGYYDIAQTAGFMDLSLSEKKIQVIKSVKSVKSVSEN